MMPSDYSALLNHLWQSTAFAAAAGLLTLIFRRHGAAVRFRIWMVASLKFLLPFSLLVDAGGRLTWNTGPQANVDLPAVISAATEAFVLPAAPAGSASSATWWTLPLLIVWAVGAAAVATRWCRAWVRVQGHLRSGRAVAMQGPLRVVAAPGQVEPGIFGLLRPVLLIPESLPERLTPEEFRAVLAHEFCHARRRDNLWSFCHMVVCIIFWFHPVVWWIGARLLTERERACDEAVLGSGCSPEIYAAGILQVCRFYLESPLPCRPGVTGADLKRRIRRIMDPGELKRLTAAGKAMLAGALIFATSVPFAAGLLLPVSGRAQESALRFEVAVIKPVKGGGGRGAMDLMPGGGLRMDTTTLKDLISLAYGIQDDRITGGPKWINSETYSLLAKPERSAAADTPASVAAPGTTAWNRMQQRLQNLLKDRFRLQVSEDRQEVSGYALVIARGGFRLRPTDSGAPPGTMRSPGRIDGRNGTIEMLATVLSRFLGRPVEDRTGLNGGYDYKLEYGQPSQATPGMTGNDVPSEIPGPSVFIALQEQLGLKLEPARVRQLSIRVIRAEKPSSEQ